MQKFCDYQKYIVFFLVLLLGSLPQFGFSGRTNQPWRISSYACNYALKFRPFTSFSKWIPFTSSNPKKILLYSKRQIYPWQSKYLKRPTALRHYSTLIKGSGQKDACFNRSCPQKSTTNNQFSLDNIGSVKEDDGNVNNACSCISEAVLALGLARNEMRQARYSTILAIRSIYFTLGKIESLMDPNFKKQLYVDSKEHDQFVLWAESMHDGIACLSPGYITALTRIALNKERECLKTCQQNQETLPQFIAVNMRNCFTQTRTKIFEKKAFELRKGLSLVQLDSLKMCYAMHCWHGKKITLEQDTDTWLDLKEKARSLEERLAKLNARLIEFELDRKAYPEIPDVIEIGALFSAQ